MERHSEGVRRRDVDVEWFKRNGEKKKKETDRWMMMKRNKKYIKRDGMKEREETHESFNERKTLR